MQPDLLFLGTEFGLYFTVDGGNKWLQLSGDVPTISFRDLAIQRRENDLVGATFGRGFYILDDYTALRHVNGEALEQDAILFPTRAAHWYQEGTVLGGSGQSDLGAGHFIAENPPFGAVFTYFLGEDLQGREQKRQAAEEPLLENGSDTPFPGWDAVEAERRETDPAILILIRDSDGNIVRRVSAETEKGIHRVAWDLRYAHNEALPAEESYFGPLQGYLAAPGKYTATLVSRVDGATAAIADPINFDVVQMRSGVLSGSSTAETVAYWQQVAALERSVNGAIATIAATQDRIKVIEEALDLSRADPGSLNDSLDAELHTAKQELYDIEMLLNGNQAKAEIGARGPHAIVDRVMVAGFGSAYSTYGPTATQKRSFEIATEEYSDVRSRLDTVTQVRLPEIESKLHAAGAPWTPGSALPRTD